MRDTLRKIDEIMNDDSVGVGDTYALIMIALDEFKAKESALSIQEKKALSFLCPNCQAYIGIDWATQEDQS